MPGQHAIEGEDLDGETNWVRTQRPSSETMSRIALRALALLIVLPTGLIIYLFHDRFAGKEVVLGLALVVAVLGFYLLWTMIRAVANIQTGLTRISRGETDTLEIPGAPSQLQEMTAIINALNKLTMEFRENAAQLEKFIQQFAALAELTEIAAKVPDIHQLLSLVLGKAATGVQARHGTVLLVSSDRQSLEIAATEGWNPGEEARSIPMSGSVAENVVRSGKALLIKRESEGEIDVLQATDADLYPSHSYMVLPLRSKSDVLGVVCLANKATGIKFSEHDVQFVTVLLGQIGHAIENARLLNQAREAARHLKQTVEDQEVKIKDAQGRIQQAEKLSSLGQLAGGVAHDFNNLLQAVLAYTKLAQQQITPSSRVHQDLDEVRKAAERAAKLTRQLLAFGRRQVLQPVYLDLNATVQDVIRMLTRLIPESIEVALSQEEGLSTVHVDPAQIEQVLMNLCLNARDAIDGNGRIAITTRDVVLTEAFCDTYEGLRPGPYVLLRVEDDGSGMDESTLHQIFEPFFTTKEVGKGTGLGLATVYGIVRQHNGVVEVSSRLGHGSAFNVYLPAATQRPQAVRRATTQSTGGTETVLVAEDAQTVRELIVRILERAGYSVLVAEDGQGAIDLVDSRGSEIALAILDAVMPKKSGRDVLEHIRSRGLDIRVLFCSGYNSEAVDTGYIQDERLPLLEKPFDPDELLRAARIALDTAPVASNPRSDG
jgi:signal transduction histidine kinase/ActR/RegA family two-component response regulator